MSDISFFNFIQDMLHKNTNNIKNDLIGNIY